MKQIILPEEQLNNLSVFLDRVQTQGIKENIAFNAIIQSINQAKEYREEKDKK